jgi:hypothetical protein
MQNSALSSIDISGPRFATLRNALVKIECAARSVEVAAPALPSAASFVEKAFDLSPEQEAAAKSLKVMAAALKNRRR